MIGFKFLIFVSRKTGKLGTWIFNNIFTSSLRSFLLWKAASLSNEPTIQGTVSDLFEIDYSEAEIKYYSKLLSEAGCEFKPEILVGKCVDNWSKYLK